MVEDRCFKILYTDHHILIAYKPAGLLTQPSGTLEDSLEGFLRQHLSKETAKVPEKVFLHAVHRLDKVTSGLVVFARSSKALSRLNEQMRRGEFEKIYHAKVEGIFKEKTGRLEHFLVHGDHRAYPTNASDPQGKKAVLDYCILEQSETCSLLRIQLKTGRYHQIRVQFATLGHPILGDHLYGSDVHFKPGMIALANTYLSFTHPVGGALLSYHCPVPSWEEK